MSDHLSESSRTRLATLQNVVVDWVRGDWPDLTNRQLALLIIICVEPDNHPVRHLADRLGVQPPIVSRILDRLSLLGLIERRIDRRDRRVVFAIPTERAASFLTDITQTLLSN